MAKKLLVPFLLLSLSACLVYAAENQQLPCKSIIITIPKTGSHLLMKCVNIMLERDVDVEIDRKTLPLPLAYFQQPVADLYGIIEQTRKVIWHTHLMYKPEYAAVFTQTATPFIFGLRDPRDQIISMARMHLKESNTTSSLEEVITEFIVHNYFGKNINNLYSNYLLWRTVPGCLTVRFEDLVGKCGGGSDELQLQQVNNIAQHLGVALTPEKAQAIAGALFGGTHTFGIAESTAGNANAGKIGSWKHAFNEEHKWLFKEVAGQLLIDLGYEVDLNW